MYGSPATEMHVERLKDNTFKQMLSELEPALDACSRNSVGSLLKSHPAKDWRKHPRELPTLKCSARWCDVFDAATPPSPSSGSPCLPSRPCPSSQRMQCLQAADSLSSQSVADPSARKSNSHPEVEKGCYVDTGNWADMIRITVQRNADIALA